MFHVPCLIPYDCWQGVVLGELCLLAGTQIMKQFCMGQILAAGVVVHLNQAQKAGKPN